MTTYNTLDEVLKEIFPIMKGIYWKSASKADMEAQLALYVRAFQGTKYTFTEIAKAMYQFTEMYSGYDSENKKVTFPHPNKIKELLTGEKYTYQKSNGVYDIIDMGRLLITVVDDHPDQQIMDAFTRGRTLKEAYERHTGLTQFEVWTLFFRNYTPGDQARINLERKRIREYNEKLGVRCCQPFKIFTSINDMSEGIKAELKNTMQIEYIPDDTVRIYGTQYALTEYQKEITREWWKNYDVNIKNAYQYRQHDRPPVHVSMAEQQAVVNQLDLGFTEDGYSDF